MRRSILALSTVLVLAAFLAPVTLAADDLTPVATAAPFPVEGQGEIVIDPTFIAETPDPVAPSPAPPGSPT